MTRSPFSVVGTGVSKWWRSAGALHSLNREPWEGMGFDVTGWGLQLKV